MPVEDPVKMLGGIEPEPARDPGHRHMPLAEEPARFAEADRPVIGDGRPARLRLEPAEQGERVHPRQRREAPQGHPPLRPGFQVPSDPLDRAKGCRPGCPVPGVSGLPEAGLEPQQQFKHLELPLGAVPETNARRRPRLDLAQQAEQGAPRREWPQRQRRQVHVRDIMHAEREARRARGMTGKPEPVPHRQEDHLPAPQPEF